MGNTKKVSKRKIKYPIDQKIKDLHNLIVTKGCSKKIEELQKYIDFIHWGIEK